MFFFLLVVKKKSIYTKSASLNGEIKNKITYATGDELFLVQDDLLNVIRTLPGFNLEKTVFFHANISPWLCAHAPNEPVTVGACVRTFSNTREVALFFFLVLVHGVLKWLHHLLLKYETLWHPVVSSHNCLHSSRLGTFA